METKNTKINNMNCSKDMEYEVNNITDPTDMGDDMLLNDVDPDFCMDAKTFFKVINEQINIQKQQSVHSTESIEKQKTA